LVGIFLALKEIIVLSDSTSFSRCPGSPNQCSLHGSCVMNRQGEHVCNCEWGYHAFDCSKSM
jgi:hypothetical protein